MPEADRNSLHIPFPSWARDDSDRPELDYENWKELSRWASRLGSSTLGIIDMGDSAVSIGFSKAFWPLMTTTLETVTGTLSAADDISDTVGAVMINGIQVAEVTIPAGEIKSPVTSVNAGMTINDFWQMNVTGTGSGALALTYYGGFS